MNFATLPFLIQQEPKEDSHLCGISALLSLKGQRIHRWPVDPSTLAIQLRFLFPQNTEVILPFLLVGLLLAHARTPLQYFKWFHINNKYVFLLISSKCGSKIGRFHTSFLIDQAVLPAPKFIPENHCSNNAQVKIKELRILSTFDLAASKNDFVK